MCEFIKIFSPPQRKRRYKNVGYINICITWMLHFESNSEPLWICDIIFKSWTNFWFNNSISEIPIKLVFYLKCYSAILWILWIDLSCIPFVEFLLYSEDLFLFLTILQPSSPTLGTLKYLDFNSRILQPTRCSPLWELMELLLVCLFSWYWTSSEKRTWEFKQFISTWSPVTMGKVFVGQWFLLLVFCAAKSTALKTIIDHLLTAVDGIGIM